MSNTIIRLKKSSVPSEIPANLEFGEIAINYADGLIYYKDSSNTIQHISSGANSYSTVNVGGTFLTAAIQNAILSINAGDNIELTPDFLNDAFTITANIKLAYDVANAAYNAANAIGGGVDVTAIYNQANSAYDVANSSFDKANSANVLAYNTGVGANAYTDVSTQAANNYAGVMANSANAYAASLTPDLSPAFNKANDAYTVANSAFARANTGGGGSSNSFTTIAVPGQSNIVASISDTLTINPTTGINITTDPISKTITISSPTGPNADFGWINTAFSSTNDYGSI